MESGANYDKNYNSSETMNNKISLVEKIGYGSGDMAANLLFHTWNLILLKFYVDVFGISPAAAATMFGVTRILDIVTDPLIGILSDRTQSRWGRYRPWILIGSIPLGVTGYLMFITPDLDEGGKLVFAWVTYSLALLLYTIVQIPYSALMGVMTPDVKQRTELSTFRFFMAFGGQMIINVAALYLVNYFGGTGEEIDKAKGYQWTMGLFMILATILYFYTFFSTRERVTVPVNANKDNDIKGDLTALIMNAGWIILFVSALFNLIHVAVRNGSLLFYFDYYVGDESKFAEFAFWGGVAFLAGIVAANYVSRIFNKRIILQVVTCSVGVLLGLFYLIPADNYPMMVFVHCLISLLSGPIPVLLYVLYAEIADYTEWKKGRKVMALVYSTMLIGVKGGLVVGGVLAGAILAMKGYVANAEQTPEALDAIVMLVSVIPGIFALLSGLCLVFYPFSEKLMKQVEEELKQRRSNEPEDTSEGVPAS